MQNTNGFQTYSKNIIFIYSSLIWNNIMCNFKEKAEKQENSDRLDLTKYTEICKNLACQLPV